MEIVVLMLVYNEAARVERALDSLVKQTDQDFELIIIDDGSTDNTVDVIIDCLNDARFDWSIEINRNNLGLVKSVQKSIEYLPRYRYSDQAFMVRLDGDDEFAPNTIEVLKEGCKYAYRPIVYGNYVEIIDGKETLVKPSNLYEALACAVAMPVQSLFLAGGLVSDDDVGIFVEYDLYARLLALDCIPIKLDTILYKYHRRNSSTTGNKDRVINSLEKLRQKWGNEIVSKIREY